MIEVRVHGRGGQGAVVASKVLAEAAVLKGNYVQSYPQYGVERRGAPLVAFARIGEPGDEFFVRQDIREPDHLIVMDPTLLASADVLVGLKPAFVRFPGGCWVEGDTMSLAYRWKQTIGDPAERRTQHNIWQYEATHGLGYHEYLQL